MITIAKLIQSFLDWVVCKIRNKLSNIRTLLEDESIVAAKVTSSNSKYCGDTMCRDCLLKCNGPRLNEVGLKFYHRGDVDNLYNMECTVCKSKLDMWPVIKESTSSMDD